MDDTSTYLKFADDLELLLTGKLSCESFKSVYASSRLSNIFDIMCNVEHFISDSDIREKDSRYRTMQEKEMRKLIQMLRTGNIDDAKLISLLGN